MDKPIELSIEKQFSIRSFQSQVERMNLEQAQDFLVELYEQMLMREVMYQEFVKHQWGLEAGPSFE